MPVLPLQNSVEETSGRVPKLKGNEQGPGSCSKPLNLLSPLTCPVSVSVLLRKEAGFHTVFPHHSPRSLPLSFLLR